MFVKVTARRNVTTLLGTGHVKAFVRNGEETEVRFLPDAMGRPAHAIRVDEPLPTFEGLPGFMGTRLVTPHDDPRPALVNMGLVAMAEDCAEGTLLHLVGGSRLLIDSLPVEVLSFADAFEVMAPDGQGRGAG